MIIQILLILYIALPSLVVGVIEGLVGNSLITGIGLSVLQVFACTVIFRLNKRRLLIISLVVFLILIIAASAAAGIFIQWSFLRLICNLSPGPLLTVVFVVIYKISRPNDFRKLSVGINRIIILLTSFSSILIMLKIRFIIDAESPVSVQDIFFGFYEALNFLPAIYFLRMLRNSSVVSLEMKEGRLWCRNEEITDLFSKNEIYILNKIVDGTRRILCREIVSGLNEEYKCTPGNCKASICPAYAVIYRNVKSLDRKLENLGIGMIASPENKRDIVSEGWVFVQSEDVRISRGRRTSISIPSVSEVSNNLNKRFWSLAAVVLTCIAGAFLLVWDMSKVLMRPLSKIEVAASVLLGAVILFQPLVGSGKNFFKQMLLSIALLLIISLCLLPHLGEAAALFMFVKAFGLLILCFLMRFPVLEERLNLDTFKENAPDLLFWLIWFFSVILSFFIEPVFPGFENMYGNSSGRLVSYLFNRLLLFSLFAVSAGFFSLSRKSLQLDNEPLVFNYKPLPPGLSKTNMILLQEFAARRGESVRCNEILQIISPGKVKNCREDCKPSACSNYQNIYKRIQTVRKYIQITGIGTIISPERKAFAHKEGWTLILYDDVYIKT